MIRVYYRISLSAVCALAAMAGPVYFLEDRVRTGYLLGGLGAALLAWGLLHLTIKAEGHLTPELQAILGAATAVLSWATISLVAFFDIIPHVLAHGLSLFDPVWLMGGLAPLLLPLVAWWRTAHEKRRFWAAASSTLFRFSAPLFGLLYSARLVGLPRQYRWLFLFTGIMFLVLDGLGTGRALPLTHAPERPAGQGQA